MHIMTTTNFESWNFESKCHLVVNVGLAHVAPHRQVREAQHHRMLRHHAVGHHMLVDVASAVHLREGRDKESLRSIHILDKVFLFFFFLHKSKYGHVSENTTKVQMQILNLGKMMTVKVRKST